MDAKHGQEESILEIQKHFCQKEIGSAVIRRLYLETDVKKKDMQTLTTLWGNQYWQ